MDLLFSTTARIKQDDDLERPRKYANEYKETRISINNTLGISFAVFAPEPV